MRKLLIVAILAASANCHGSALPTVFQALTGCTNPNTGISNGDWGTNNNPLYADPQALNNISQSAYTTNTIFWTSRETGPGQSVLLTGAFTSSPKTVAVAVIPSGTTNWQNLVAASKTIVPAVETGSTVQQTQPPQSAYWLSFTVPSTMAAGVYGFEIIDPTAPAVYGLANQPTMSWVMGEPSAPGAGTALQHEVYDCGAEPGGNLRVFGKNFVSTDKVVLQGASGKTWSLSKLSQDSNSITARVPAALAAGPYSLWVGSVTPDAGTSLPAKITVYPSPKYTVKTVTCSIKAAPVDSTAALQACLTSNAPPAGGLSYIKLGAGNYLISATMTMSPYEVLVGAGAGKTNIAGASATTPSTWFNLPQYSGLANLSFKAAANPNLITSSNIWNSSPTVEGHTYISGINVQDPGTYTNPSEQIVILSGPDVQVYNSYFLSSEFQAFDLDLGDGAVITGNTFVLNNYTGYGISDSQNVDFAKNTTTSQLPPLPNNPNNLGAGTGLSINRGNSYLGASAVSQNIYIGYNSMHDTGMTGQEVIGNDGGGGSYLGPMTSSTASQVVLADAPNWTWMGTTNPQAAVMVIVSGTGAGQYSLLSSWLGQTIGLLTPWKVLPDSTSIVSITQVELNLIVAHNTLTNTLGAAVELSNAMESAIEDNTISNSDSGIIITASGPYGSPVSYESELNTDVLNNTLSAGRGDFIATQTGNPGGIGFATFPGCLMSGMMVRGNTVPAKQTYFLTDGWNLLNGLLSEQNAGAWSPTFPLPGLLLQ